MVAPRPTASLNAGLSSAVQAKAAPSLSFGQMMGNFNSQITPFTSSLRDITRNLAGGFAKDPAVAAQYRQQNQEIDAQRAQMRQQNIERLMQNFNVYAEAMQASGGPTPGIQKLLDQNVALLTGLGIGEDEARMMADAAVEIGSVIPATEANYQQFYNPQTQQSQAVNVSDPAAVQQAQAAGFTSLGSPESSDLLSEGALGQKAYLATLSAPKTNVSLPPQESEFAKEFGKGQAQEAVNLGKAAMRGTQMIDQAAILRELIGNMEASGNDPGKLAGLKADTAGYLQSIGVDPSSLGLPADAGPTQAVDAALNRLALNFIGADSGGLPANSFSEADRKFITQIAGTTADTAEGLRLKMDVLDRAAQKMVQANNIWLQNYDQTAEGYQRFIKDWSKTSLSKGNFDDLRSETGVLKKSGNPQRDRAGGNLTPEQKQLLPEGFVPD